MCALSILKNGSDRAVLYFIDMGKAGNIKKNKNIMRLENSQGYLGSRFSKEVENRLFNSCDFFSQAIENADGVPYQLIFGNGTGEGQSLVVGDGIRQLLGITSGAFSEKVFQGMIEEIVPTRQGYPCRQGGVAEKIAERGNSEI